MNAFGSKARVGFGTFPHIVHVGFLKIIEESLVIGEGKVGFFGRRSVVFVVVVF